MENLDGAAGNSIPPIIANNLRVEQILGRGGMGTVYRATHLGLDRLVAVKVINPEFAMDSDVMQRFTREARLMARLRHPRAAMIYDSGKLPDGRLFIVMEYVEGTTLADILKRDRKIPYKKAVDIAVSICDVLQEAHANGIIHRDLKPANIMLNQQGVFVLDFGIAKMLNRDNAESLKLSMTGKGLLVGTPFYMSPEQCLGEPVEARSDLYSLGALLFEMLAGRPPFNDEVLSAVIIKHAMVEAPKIEELAPEVPPALASVVNRLLAKKPADRPESAAATKNLLEMSLAGETSPQIAFDTRVDTASNLFPATQQLRAVTDSQIPKPEAAEVKSASDDGPSGLKVAALSATAVILLGLLAFGGYRWMRPAPVVSSSNSNSAMPEMDHSQHKMPMGDDFAKTPAGDDKNAASVPIISQEEADRVILRITSTTEHRADGYQIIKTPKDSAIVCIHNMIDMGKTHMFAIERANVNSQWEITARVSLDVPEFRGTNWIFEPEDIDGDGFEEVVFKGENSGDGSHRILIYVPRTRQSYSVVADGKAANTFSPNALATNGAPFKKALERMLAGK
ncbi:MAG: serine/threonine protein kinase [Acidobacteria bacterium]|nr:serine/threonine protein kinase [Acidobacteriota bacterium]